MAPRSTRTSSIADLIADAVRAAFPVASRAARTTSPRSTKAKGGRAARSGKRAAAAVSATPVATAAVTNPQSPSGPSTPAAAAGAEAPGESKAASTLAAQRAAEKELLDRVRADLQAAYEGVPVSPERIAFRLKVDRDLVDAALMYLVRRKEARSKWVKGRPAYTPAFPH